MLYKNLFDYNKQHQELLASVGAPLQDNFGFQFLAYRRFLLSENKLIYLVNHDQWLFHLFENNNWSSQFFYKLINNFRNKNYFTNIWPDSPDASDMIYNRLYDNNIWHGIVLYIKLDDCIETFCFTGNRESNAIKNFFVNNIDILDKFSHYFKYKCRDLIEKIDLRSCIDFEVNMSIEDGSAQKIRADLEINNYFLRIGGKDIPITTRESECLYYLSHGRTFKEIAKFMNISARTVEDYMKKIKLKTGVVFANQLIDIYQQQIERIPAAFNV